MDTTTSATFYEHLPLPTIDRPFGIKLWPIFSKAWELVMGYPADDFRFEAGVTPMSTLKSTGIFVICYYMVIFIGREIMRKKEPLQLKKPFLVHNFCLTAISGILLALFVEQVFPTVVRGGIFHAICDRSGGWTQPLVVLYYVCLVALVACPLHLTPEADIPSQLNYITKYIELADTVFLVLKKKPLSTWPTNSLSQRHVDLPANCVSIYSLPALLPPWRYRSPLLHPASWQHLRVLGRHLAESDCPRAHVLVLLSERPRCSLLVEGVGHSSPDHPVCHRSWSVPRPISPDVEASVRCQSC